MAINDLDLNKFIFIPATDVTSIGVGYNCLNVETSGAHNTCLGNSAGSLITTGSSNLLIGYNVGSTNLTTGSNNIVIGTSSAADTAAASTSNSFWLGGGSTAIMSATAINSTPTVTIPGNLTVSGTFTPSGGTVSSLTNAASTAQVDVTSSTTLVTVTGCTVPLVASGKYQLEAYVPCTSGTSGGVKAGFVADGTLTATSIDQTIELYTASGVAVAHATALGSAGGSTAIVILAKLTGFINVNVAGNVILQFAQNASNGTTSSAYLGSWIKATRIA